jgi:acetyl/propionyl-CoA carboxylase alpha subunit
LEGNAGTAEFLVQGDEYYFIEINPRIQVEHTITEEITGIDIVAAQIQIAAGATLEQLGLTQDRISTRGFAVQCRITTSVYSLLTAQGVLTDGVLVRTPRRTSSPTPARSRSTALRAATVCVWTVATALLEPSLLLTT